MSWRRHYAYLKYVLRHKWHVFRFCCYFGHPWAGVVHDLSKFSLAEWGPYAEAFYLPDGTSRKRETDPLTAEQQAAFDSAWLHHQHHNPHHWQHWVLRQDDGELKTLEMPNHFIKEMVADWKGAGAAQGQADTKGWYRKQQNKIQMHPLTRAKVERLLGWDDDPINL